ncbi:hypothetical protein B6U96_13080 [Archaeoglobales archaeon ex4484_92]|nr:MAG: hypothetical protein B6U96_13080 [Archaeoglobales archaeon ex4484_92]
MLIPVRCRRCGKRMWVEFSIGFEKSIFAGNEAELAKYTINRINMIKVWGDEELAEEIREQFRRFIKAGDSIEKAVKIISELYGIPVLVLEEFLEDLIAEAKMLRYENR